MRLVQLQYVKMALIAIVSIEVALARTTKGLRFGISMLVLEIVVGIVLGVFVLGFLATVFRIGE